MNYTFEDVLPILKKINDAGFVAYLTGGSVRDYLIYHNFADIDIASDAKPEELANVFGIARYDKFAATFGTFKALVNGLKLEITTFRLEGEYKDKRHPHVTFIKDAQLDSKRRDFTINAMYLDQFGDILDYHGGQKDIENKVISCVGDADERIKEDPVRILRAIRFAMNLGFTIDEDLSLAIKNNIDLVDGISQERQKLELQKFLKIAPIEEIRKTLDKYNIDITTKL